MNANEVIAKIKRTVTGTKNTHFQFIRMIMNMGNHPDVIPPRYTYQHISG
jgi:hypothetical protein